LILRRKTMAKILKNGGYQPTRLQEGYQPSAPTAAKGKQTTVATPLVIIKPPKGGSGETVLKKNP
jgi:hypothetical protein